MLPFEPIRAIHFVALLFSATSACALFFLGLRFMSRFWAWLASSPVCALSRRSIGARNSSEYGALHVVSAHPLADCFCHRSKQADKATVLFMVLAGALTGVAFMFKQVAIVNWLLLTASLSGIRIREKTDGALQFHSPLGQRQAC